jgi:hypothetical protein
VVSGDTSATRSVASGRLQDVQIAHCVAQKIAAALPALPHSPAAANSNRILARQLLPPFAVTPVVKEVLAVQDLPHFRLRF